MGGVGVTTDEHLERIEKSIADVNQHLASIDRYLLDFRTETINRLELIDSRLTTLAGLYQSLDARMSPLSKAVLDFGAIATRMQIEQSRVAKLVEPAA
jgi:hypothetical protein